MDKNNLTHKTHEIADHTGLSFNSLLTHYFLEVILSRIATSTNSKYFILKGGILLANILGVKTRTTVDIDLLVTGVDMTEEIIRSLINQALIQPESPEVICEIQSIEPIRFEDKYGGFRVRILCKLDNIRQIVPLDLATGDPITPEPIKFDYIPLYPGKPLTMIAYNIETILAEKVETVYRRGVANSRCKDFYDIHVIWETKMEIINFEVLRDAFARTCSHRLTKFDQSKFNNLIKVLRTDDQMRMRWKAYLKRNTYARKISFNETLTTMSEIIQILSI